MRPVESFAKSNPFWKCLRTMKGPLAVGFNCDNFTPVLMLTTANERDSLKLYTTWDSSKSKKPISDRVQTVLNRRTAGISLPSSNSFRLNWNFKRPSPPSWVFLILLHIRSLLPRSWNWTMVDSSPSLNFCLKPWEKHKIVKWNY